MDYARLHYFLMKPYKIIFLILSIFFITSCNKDDVIEDIQQKAPVINLDSETGIYQIKVGRELTIAPQVENSTGAIFSWIIDGKLVSTSPTLTISFDKPQDVYVIFRVETLAGTAEEELKIEVVDYAPPIISIAIPSTGIKVLPNTDYTISPDFQNVDDSFTCRWILNGETVSETTEYVFNEAQLGFYTLTIEATNEDGTTTRDIDIEVVDQLPYKVSFPPASYFQTTTDRTVVLGRSVWLQPRLDYIENPVFEWYIEDVLVDGMNESVLIFTPDKAGDYKITVKVRDDIPAARNDNKHMSKGETTLSANVMVHCYNSPGTVRPITTSSSKYQNRVYEFVPAPGQFVGETSLITDYTGDETTHDDALAYATRRLNENKFVSLGAFGGYIIVGFDHSIKAGAGEYDFAIQGNAFGGSCEPGIVWVMQDTNGNGLPDDEWYELRGSETGKNETIQNYAVTYYRPAGSGMSVRWTDSEGKQGQVDYLKQYHNQPYYYPTWIEADSYTLYGTRLSSKNTVDPNTGFWVNASYEWGYVDNLGTDALLGGNTTDGSGQRNGFKISNAMYPDGASLALDFIDFIKVQTGCNTKSVGLGENSTEVFGFTDLSM